MQEQTEVKARTNGDESKSVPSVIEQKTRYNSFALNPLEFIIQILDKFWITWKGRCVHKKGP